VKIFVSWSGDRSKSLATLLKTWMPNVLATAEIWLSDVDIQKGVQWMNAITAAASTSDAGLVVITPENVGSPWINFEAGAMVRSFGDERLCPLLLGLNKADLPTPLGGYNATAVESRDDFEKLVLSLRPGEIPEPVARHAFAREWDAMNEQVQVLLRQKPEEDAPPARTEEDKIDEILDHIRSQARSERVQKHRSRNLRSNTSTVRGVRLAMQDYIFDLYQDAEAIPDYQASSDGTVINVAVKGPRPKTFVDDEATRRLFSTLIDRSGLDALDLVFDDDDPIRFRANYT
jgi:hypothetical protein